MFNPILFYQAGRQTSKPFVAQFDTTKPGSTASNQLKLPISISGTINANIDWGDGNIELITSVSDSRLTHTYSTSGVYTVKIFGNINNGFRFSNSLDKSKLIKIIQFGKVLTGISEFYGCNNLTLTDVADTPSSFGTNFMRSCTAITSINNLGKWDLLSTNSCNNWFFDAANFDGVGVMLWDVSNVIDFTNTFRSNPLMVQDLSVWNFNKNANFQNFLFGKTPSTYSSVYLANIYIKMAALLIGTGRTESSKLFNASTAKYNSSGSSARAALVADGWTLLDGGMI